VWVAGAADSVIKLWDIRQLRSARAAVPVETAGQPSQSLHLAAACPTPEDQVRRSHGVVSMTVHPETNRLLASCANSRHYLFDALRPDKGVIASYDGHEAGSFYIRAAFSPCGTHFASGSSDKSLRIWQVRLSATLGRELCLFHISPSRSNQTLLRI
jgi:denticleless